MGWYIPYYYLQRLVNLLDFRSLRILLRQIEKLLPFALILLPMWFEHIKGVKHADMLFPHTVLQK